MSKKVVEQPVKSLSLAEKMCALSAGGRRNRRRRERIVEIQTRKELEELSSQVSRAEKAAEEMAPDYFEKVLLPKIKAEAKTGENSLVWHLPVVSDETFPQAHLRPYLETILEKNGFHSTRLTFPAGLQIFWPIRLD